MFQQWVQYQVLKGGLKMANFIKLNHGVVDTENIVGVGTPYYNKVEVQPRKRKVVKRQNSLGIQKKKIRRVYMFTVWLKRGNLNIAPTIVPFNSSTNTKRLCLRKHKELTDLLLNIK